MKQNIFTRVLEPILQSSSHLVWEAQEESEATTKAAEFFLYFFSYLQQQDSMASDRAKTFVQPVVPRFDGHYNY